MADPGVLTMRAAERIYLSWTITGIPSGATVKISIDGGAALVAAWDGTTLKALVAGSAAPPGAAVATLGVGSHPVVGVVDDTPELLRIPLGSVVVQ